MTGWTKLRELLDGIAANRQVIRVWWRDDDAGRDDPALGRLLDLAEQHGLPVALAVVPAWLDERAQARIAGSSRASVLQHGFAHADHAPSGAKSIELGGRDPAEVADELARGRADLVEAFGASFVAVMVPPWNRIEPDVAGRLRGLGFVGLSTFGRRTGALTASGVEQVNTHVDPVDWRGTRLFLGEAAALEQVAAALDADEPLGILSHHLVMDEPGWRFLERLLTAVARHPAVRFAAASELFGTAP